MKHWGSRAYQVCSNDGPRLTLTYLTSRSNLLHNAFRTDFLKDDFFKMLKPKSFKSLTFDILDKVSHFGVPSIY